MTRVMTPETEEVWVETCAGRTMREIQPMISGRKSGNLPGDPADPKRLRHPVRFEVSGPTLALLRDARRELEDACGERLDDDQLVAALCQAVLGGGGKRRARHQIAITTCDRCERGWQDGAGEAIEVPTETIEKARCDAQHLGRVDAATPTRAVQDVTPALRRLIWRRDHGCCIVPGCRSSRYLEIHHLVPRAEGGAHSADNCGLLCGAHHDAVHADRLIIQGTLSTGLSFSHADGRPYGAAPAAAAADALRDDAIAALRGLGFSAAESRDAVADAISTRAPRRRWTPCCGEPSRCSGSTWTFDET